MTDVIGLMKATATSVKKTHNRRSSDTKNKILDAAEQLFSECGFYGTSVREITKLSGVQVSLSYYHFGSKEAILKAVVDRRADQHIEDHRRLLRNNLAANQGRPLPVEQLIGIFVRPSLERLVGGDAGWKRYVQLLSHLAFESARSEHAFVFFKYDEVIIEFIDEFKRSTPDADPKDLNWAFYFLQSAHTHSLLEAQIIDRQSNHLCDSSNIEELILQMQTFFGSGLLALKSQTKATNP
ncbi:TetR/AcrR family transcriptional regulator [Luminiphilus sp. nBUS_16]|uniref:TetR/AcrR family transcriptional regulator n=1 Tax=Luminiphilus sp. nBUS_16 TaxID=3395315 RepID=UPI003EB7D6E8